MSKNEKIYELLHAVLFGTPDEAKRVLINSETEYTGRALGAACRFRGLEMVKALVEGGAKFTHDRVLYNSAISFIFEDHYGFIGYSYETDYPLMLLRNIGFRYVSFNNGMRTWIQQTEVDDMLIKSEPLPVSEIMRSLDYLMENAERTMFVPEVLLYYSILMCDDEIYEALKKRGVSGFPKSMSLNMPGSAKFNNIVSAFRWQPLNKLLIILERLEKELNGKKLGFSDKLYEYRQIQLLDPKIWRMTLEMFDRKRMNQMRLMKLFINNNAANCLMICEEYGWLRESKKRDKLLEYSSKQGRTECTAYLLELKKRADDIPDGFDGQMFDLDYDEPAPPEDTQKVWNYIKRRDGTLCITGYKGSRTELDIPERIGKFTVTAIGDEAFSCVRLQMSAKETSLRRSVTKITLPPTIRAVGRKAFFGCPALTEVNIPESVTEIERNAFGGCTNLTLKIPRSAYAESYCIKNKVNYIFTEGKNL